MIVRTCPPTNPTPIVESDGQIRFLAFVTLPGQRPEVHFLTRPEIDVLNAVGETN